MLKFTKNSLRLNIENVLDIMYFLCFTLSNKFIFHIHCPPMPCVIYNITDDLSHVTALILLRNKN
jgi:hypothetical protein